MRPSKDKYYLGIALAASQRSTCLRMHYGAIIVKDDRIIATGYNGAPSGEPNCCDVGRCERMEKNIPHGERYELCKSVHAEMNAIMRATENTKGATLYLAGVDMTDGKIVNAKPCSICARLIKQSGLRVVNTSFDDQLGYAFSVDPHEADQ